MAPLTLPLPSSYPCVLYVRSLNHNHATSTTIMQCCTRVMATGIINWQLNWDALMKDKNQTKEEAREEIYRVFTAVTLKELWRCAPEPKNSIGALVQVGACTRARLM